MRRWSDSGHSSPASFRLRSLRSRRLKKAAASSPARPGARPGARARLGVSVKVPYRTFTKSLATIEWSPVEPQFEKKYYVSGIGEVKEQVTQGGHERFELVSLTHG